jgi:hypothetical protein
MTIADQICDEIRRQLKNARMRNYTAFSTAHKPNKVVVNCGLVNSYYSMNRWEYGPSRKAVLDLGVWEYEHDLTMSRPSSAQRLNHEIWDLALWLNERVEVRTQFDLYTIDLEKVINEMVEWLVFGHEKNVFEFGPTLKIERPHNRLVSSLICTGGWPE